MKITKNIQNEKKTDFFYRMKNDKNIQKMKKWKRGLRYLIVVFCARHAPLSSLCTKLTTVVHQERRFLRFRLWNTRVLVSVSHRCATHVLRTCANRKLFWSNPPASHTDESVQVMVQEDATRNVRVKCAHVGKRSTQVLEHLEGRERSSRTPFVGSRLHCPVCFLQCLTLVRVCSGYQATISVWACDGFGQRMPCTNQKSSCLL